MSEIQAENQTTAMELPISPVQTTNEVPVNTANTNMPVTENQTSTETTKPKKRHYGKRSFDEKACVKCGKMFTPESGNQKYCCPECRKEANATPTNKYERTCKYCGETFEADHWNSAYCCDEHKKAYLKADKLRISAMNCARRKLKSSGRLNEWSAKKWMADVWTPNDEFDTVEGCWKSTNDELSPLELRRRELSKCCVHCGQQFVAKRVNQKYCREDCLDKAKQKANSRQAKDNAKRAEYKSGKI